MTFYQLFHLILHEIDRFGCFMLKSGFFSKSLVLCLIKKPKNDLLPTFSPDFTWNRQIWLFYAEKWIFFKKLGTLLNIYFLKTILLKNALLLDLSIWTTAIEQNYITDISKSPTDMIQIKIVHFWLQVWLTDISYNLLYEISDIMFTPHCNKIHYALVLKNCLKKN